MELAFDERKLLLPGIHDSTLDELKDGFGRFQRSDRRQALFSKLSDYINALRKAECGQSLLIDGSFVMACIDEPDDIDAILVFPAEWDLLADLKPYQYNVVSKRSVKKAFNIDVFLVQSGTIEETEWIEFFSLINLKWRQKFDWPDSVRKGMIRVML